MKELQQLSIPPQVYPPSRVDLFDLSLCGIVNTEWYWLAGLYPISRPDLQAFPPPYFPYCKQSKNSSGNDLGTRPCVCTCVSACMRTVFTTNCMWGSTTARRLFIARDSWWCGILASSVLCVAWNEASSTQTNKHTNAKLYRECCVHRQVDRQAHLLVDLGKSASPGSCTPWGLREEVYKEGLLWQLCNHPLHCTKDPAGKMKWYGRLSPKQWRYNYTLVPLSLVPATGTAVTGTCHWYRCHWYLPLAPLSHIATKMHNKYCNRRWGYTRTHSSERA